MCEGIFLATVQFCLYFPPIMSLVVNYFFCIGPIVMLFMFVHNTHVGTYFTETGARITWYSNLPMDWTTG
jgi:hypothetical protein